jgi:predicted phosphoribosyltransferase
MRIFQDRHEAGEILAGKIDNNYFGRDDVIVLGLPRGGVPVAYEIAKRLRAPLDVFIVRKLGVPGFEELAAGAIASGGVRVLNDDVVRALPNAMEIIDAVTVREQAELARREKLYRDDRPPLDVRGRTVILVDDGLATGATMRAAVTALRQEGAAKIIVAVPVGAPETCRELESLADETICATAPEYFHAVGQFYENFAQTTDDEVRELLAAAACQSSKPSTGGQEQNKFRSP